MGKRYAHNNKETRAEAMSICASGRERVVREGLHRDSRTSQKTVQVLEWACGLNGMSDEWRGEVQ
jgi:hypothetical protein